MGWSLGWDSTWQRDIGYGVPAECDHPDCTTKIDRGLSHVCSNQEPHGGDGCGLYFCGKHQSYLGECTQCQAGLPPFEPKPDIEKWNLTKLLGSRWSEWRTTEEGQKFTKNNRSIMSKAKMFVTKSEAVQAIQWTGENREELKDFMGDASFVDGRVAILEIGDFIVRNENGDMTYISEEEFLDRYELEADNDELDEQGGDPSEDEATSDQLLVWEVFPDAREEQCDVHGWHIYRDEEDEVGLDTVDEKSDEPCSKEDAWKSAAQHPAVTGEDEDEYLALESLYLDEKGFLRSTGNPTLTTIILGKGRVAIGVVASQGTLGIRFSDASEGSRIIGEPVPTERYTLVQGRSEVYIEVGSLESLAVLEGVISEIRLEMIARKASTPATPESE
jgi:hypothetical protein